MPSSQITIERQDETGIIWLDRADKLNALSVDMWVDLPTAVAELGGDERVRSLLVAGKGKAFTVGIDLAMLAAMAPEGESEAERRMRLFHTIKGLQRTFSSLAECPKPVIAAIHGYCLGAGIDLITACDLRLASADAVFGVRETRMGLVADVGTMQRLPRILNPGHVAELVFTGDDIDAARAAEIGLVNRVYPNQQTLFEAALSLTGRIGANSPLVVQGAKSVLRAGANRSIDEALDYMALWNAAFLLSDDLTEAIGAHGEQRPPEFTGR